MPIQTPNLLFAYLLRLGDSALVLSQRLSELCGKGPTLEEDMALANTALDLLGQARLWLSYAAETGDAGQDEDALAFFRTDRQFFNFLLVEQPNGNYADLMVRQFLFDSWHILAIAELMRSTDSRIAEIAAKADKEVRYHLRRSADLLVRMGDGTELSHTYTQTALDRLWPFTGEMFVPDTVDAELAASGRWLRSRRTARALARVRRHRRIRRDTEAARTRSLDAKGRESRRSHGASRLPAG